MLGRDMHPVREPDSLPIGSLVGRHRLEMLIGRGGFGAVFAATDTVSGTPSALKVLSARVLEQTGGVARFEREAELARRLSHPNTVRVLDSGRDAHGLSYIAFELLEGRSLEFALHEGGPIAGREAARITLETLAALEEAHALSIVHRDIKPGNIFLVRTPHGEAIKVLDFGIAKSIRANTLAGLTQEGLTMGTPEYMAPEQISGQDVVPASDLFALGVVLAEMIVGRSVYAENVQTTQILMSRLMGHPLPIPDALAQSPLRPVVEKATHPTILQRFTTARDFRHAILAIFPDLATPAQIAGSVQLSPSRSGPTLNYQAVGPTHYAQAPNPSPGYTVALHHAQQTVASAPRRLEPAQPAVSAFRPFVVGQPPVQARPPRGSGVWLFVLGLVGLLSILGAGGAYFLYARDTSSQPKQRKSVLSDPNDSDESDAADPETSENLGAPEPTEAPSASSTTTPSLFKEVPCSKAATLRNEALAGKVRPLGLRVTGTLHYCTGDMVNFRCLATEGKGITVEDDGEDGGIVVLHFPKQADADAFVKSIREQEGQQTIARNGKDVLLVDFPHRAEAVVQALCN